MDGTMSLSVIILAAGQGTRMKSSLPKVLHKIAGTPMIEHVYRRSCELNANAIYIVHGYGSEQLKSSCSHFKAIWVEQTEQLGTAHAVQQVSPMVDKDDTVLVLYGDVPLIQTRTLERLIADVKGNDIALLSVVLDDPTGYGRIIRDSDNKVSAIVEDKDANAGQKKISEVNTGILAVRAGYLNDCLDHIGNNNAQGEYYLTDLIEIAVQDGNVVTTSQPESTSEVEGVNDRNQLAKLERIIQRRFAETLMTDGVTIADPARIDIRGELNAGNDSFIDVNCVFEGEVNLGTGVTIGAGCVIKNSIIACSTVIKPFSVIEDAFIGKNVEVGPFARIRPGTQLAEGSRIGNFVEVKNTQMGKNSKASHLTYLGDSEIGANVNIGAGTITCNYDGANKHKTVIKDGVFIGSDTQLVAPVTIGENATIGAGSTITKDAEGNTLTLSRSLQKTIKNWARPSKKK